MIKKKKIFLFYSFIIFNYLCNENEQACSLKEIPEGVSYLNPKNPIPMLNVWIN